MYLWTRWALTLLCFGPISCSTITARLPQSKSLEERLAGFPLRNLPLAAPARIHWSAQGVPHVVASSDDDLAFVQGLVHAHLRLGQMELLRRISQGRLSESAGPFARDLDRALRVLGFGRAASAMERALPSSTRRYLERYVAGVNLYAERASELPHEFAVLALSRESWTVGDVLTISRLAATDVNWISFVGYLGSEDPKGARDAVDALLALSAYHKSGSNSWVVDGRHSRSGFPLMANDPHLGLTVPNFWLLIGLESPETRAVGLAIPGLPIVALGRNADLAWGGTNMRSASSDLVELSPAELAESREFVESIRVRSWWDSEHRYRVSRHGPLLNDVPFLAKLERPIALKWRGHEPSDEITAFLRAQKARNVAEFRAAFADYAVSGQNFTVADRHGSIALVRAASLPRRKREQSYPILSSEEATRSWAAMWSTSEIPGELNPARGFLASANDEPPFAEPVLGRIFSPPQRVRRIEERLQALISAKQKLDLADLAELQLDTRSEASRALKDRFLARALVQDPAARRLLEEWSGDYRRELAAPVFYVSFLSELSPVLFGESLRQSDRLQELWLPRLADGQELSTELRAAAKDAEARALRVLSKYPKWEDFHRLQAAHPLSNAPLIGSRYVFGEFGVDGGIETLLKTAHSVTSERHYARYGAQARHLSDLADPNENHFVLFGGNDGWLRSENFIDQVPLWREGRLLKVPLSAERAREQAACTLELEP